MTKSKFTKKEMFNALMAKIATDEVFNVEHGDSVIKVTGAEMLDALTHEIELLNRKHTSKKDVEAEEKREHYRQLILDIVSKEVEPINIVNIQAKNEELANLKNQSIAYVLRTMVDTGMLYRTMIKRKAHFTTDITKVKEKQKTKEA